LEDFFLEGKNEMVKGESLKRWNIRCCQRIGTLGTKGGLKIDFNPYQMAHKPNIANNMDPFWGPQK